MTFAPPTILEVRALLKREDADLSDVETGIVGGPSHILQGTSYHLGADQLKMSQNPYSVRTARDKAGLSNAASALDVDDDLDELRELSVWMVEQCRAGAADTLDIREVIYSPDGVQVLRWDRERGMTSLPVPDSDLSHRTHTHFDWYRDSEFRDKTGPFRRFLQGGTMATTDVHVEYMAWRLHAMYSLLPVVAGGPEAGTAHEASAFVAAFNQLLADVKEIKARPPVTSAPVDIPALVAALTPAMREVFRTELDATQWGSVE